MKIQLKSPRLLASAVFALALTIGYAYYAPGHKLGVASAQSFTLAGTYGYLVGHPTVASLVGVLTFDAAGNVTGTYTSRNTAGAGGAGTLTGNYNMTANGSGTMFLNFDTGLSAPATIVATGSNSAVQIVFTDGIPGVMGTAWRQ